MSAPPAAEAAPAGKKSKKLPLIIGLVLLLAIGGVVGKIFFFKSADAATKDKEASSKSKKSKASKESDDEEGDAAKKKKGGDEEDEESDASAKPSKSDVSLPDDSKVKQVVELQPFIVNLADKGEAKYLRLTVNVGIGGEEGKAEKPDPLFTTRIRNAMLAVLTSKTADDVLTNEGKNALRKELLRAARKVSEEPEVHAIYITDFIVQL